MLLHCRFGCCDGLGAFNVILNTNGSNPWWIQCDEAHKIEVQLDSDKPDMLLAAIRDGPVLNWQKDGQIGGSGHIVHLLICFVVKQ